VDLLDIVLLYDCSLKCHYCTITNEMRRHSGLTTKTVIRHIDEARNNGCTALSLTGGEPTIRGDFLPLVRYARDRNFTDIKVQTNGLLFAQDTNLAKAIDAGVTRIGVSVHAYSPGDSSAYDNCVQAETGTQRIMLQAIDNLVAANVELTVDLILMTSTKASVFDALKDLHQRGVGAFNLWLVSLTDNNEKNVESLPRITELVPIITQCMDYGRAHGIQVHSLHVPRCLLPGYEEQVAHPGVGIEVKVVTPDAVFELSESLLSGGVKPERCSECCYNSVCPGLRPDYVARFGDDEPQPIIADRSSPLS
jgi:cyclic pyranopterin phosphate synthase